MLYTYRMTYAQSSFWSFSAAGAAIIEGSIAEMLKALECPEAVLVELYDGSLAFVVEVGVAK